MKHKQLQAHLNRHINGRLVLLLYLYNIHVYDLQLAEYEAELALRLGKNSMDEIPEERPEPCMIQCAFCVNTFEDAEQLQQHVLRQHITKSVEQPIDAAAELVVEDSVVPPLELQLEHLVDSKVELEIESGETPVNYVPEYTISGQVEETNLPFASDGLETCENAVQDSSKYSQHSNSMDQIKALMYECHLCKKSFNLKIKLNRHLRIHTK